MKKIMTEALAVANAASRTLFMSPRDPSWYYYPDSGWCNYLLHYRIPVRDADPVGHARGCQSRSRATGYRTLDARTNFFYGVTGSRPQWPCA
jgi:hypothetical protein